jgi:hypothetical protein
VGAHAATDERGMKRYGEVVWSWRRGAGAKFAVKQLQMTVARKPITGESTL